MSHHATTSPRLTCLKVHSIIRSHGPNGIWRHAGQPVRSAPPGQPVPHVVSVAGHGGWPSATVSGTVHHKHPGNARSTLVARLRPRRAIPRTARPAVARNPPSPTGFATAAGRLGGWRERYSVHEKIAPVGLMASAAVLVAPHTLLSLSLQRTETSPRPAARAARPPRVRHIADVELQRDTSFDPRGRRRRRTRRAGRRTRSRHCVEKSGTWSALRLSNIDPDADRQPASPGPSSASRRVRVIRSNDLRPDFIGRWASWMSASPSSVTSK